MKLSVIIIARNAENYLDACLSGVSLLTDDIVVVVDPRTTDATVKIAKAYHAHVVSRKFVNFSDQKNFAALLAVNDWLLSLDADESLSPGLLAALKSLSDNPVHHAFSIPRKNKIFGKIINHTNWDPDGIVRLYHKKYGHWQGEIHETLAIDGSLGRLFSPIYHDNYRTVTEFISRQDYYSTLRAESLIKAGVGFHRFRFIWDPAYDFFRRFIWHAGFLDGWHGLYLSYLMAVYHLCVWIKLWQKSQKV